MYLTFPTIALILSSMTPPAHVKAVLENYLAAVDAQDLRAMVALADTPWLDRDRHVVLDRADLEKAVARAASQLPRGNGRRIVRFIAYSTAREGMRKDQESERKLLDTVLGDAGWIAGVEHEDDVFSMRVILIRVKREKATVVGGPLKQNHITPKSRIPETVDRLFENADTFVLYSLEPDPRFGGTAAKGHFREYTTIGHIDVKGKPDRKRLADALRLGVEDNFGVTAFCFIPRHGIRLTGGGKAVDLVICFQCSQVHVYIDGEKEGRFLTTGTSQPPFDAILKAAGVKRAARAKE